MIFRHPEPADLERIAALEARAYPADEAASPEKLAYRIATAADCFLLAEDEGGGLLGFVCGTRAPGEGLTHGSMSSHVAAGENLCIHSVVVDPDRRRAGVGTDLVRAYLERTAELPGVQRALLICKEHLKGFYAANGFDLVGPSEVVYGQDPWFEMRRPY